MDILAEERNKKYQIIGMHEVSGAKVARVRFFIDEQIFDEDIPLPEAKSLEELLGEAIEKRLNELKKGKNE